MESKTTISLTEFNTIYANRYEINRVTEVDGYGKCYKIDNIEQMLHIGKDYLCTYNVVELYPDTKFYAFNSDEFLSEEFLNDIRLVMKYLLVNNSKYMEKKEKRVRNECQKF